MDKVTITLQNKELIEEIINSTPDLQVKVTNAILDSISKRTVKNVLNNVEVNKRIDEAVNKAKDQVIEQFFSKEPGSYGYSTVFKLKPNFMDVFKRKINAVLSEEVDKMVEETAKKIVPTYEKRLTEKLEATLKEFDEQSEKIGELVKAEVRRVIEEKFNN